MAHQWLREDKKPKQLAKRTMKKSIKIPDFGFETQIQVFKHVFFYLRKPVICPISGRDITDVMNGPIDQWIKAFAHILPKKNYPYWRLNPRNIMMVHPEVHRILDQGTLEERKKYPDWNWDLWDRETEKAKDDYRKFIKENLL